MTEPLSLLTALALGLFGASHCLVMCGGIAAAIGSQTTASGRTPAPHMTALAFNFGRICTYTLAGVLVGSLGLWLQGINDLLMLSLRTLAAALLILMGLYIARWLTWLTRVEQAGQTVWKYIQPHTRHLMSQQRLSSRFKLGLLWGLLPCGLIYSTLAWVAANGQPLLGGLAMFSFGLGTLPALFASSLAATSFTRLLHRDLVRKIAGALLIAYGFWTLSAIWLP